jgi:hypothetical protein
MKNILYILLFLFSFGELFGATYYSVANGNWSNFLWSSTSGGKPSSKIPSQSDVIYIETNINLDINLVIHSTGKLVINPSGSLTSAVNSLEIKNGGSLEVYGILQVYDLTFNNSSSIIIDDNCSLDVWNNFTNKNNTSGVIVNGAINVGNEYYNGNGSVIDGCGSINISGYYNNWGSAFGFSNEQGYGPKEIICNPLPVDLLDYKIKCTQTGSLIEWATASETNSQYFIIEKSVDLKNWKIVNSMAGALQSNSTIQYSYTDEESNDVVTYYRIKQTDTDGNYIYFDLLSILCKLNNNELKLLGVNLSESKLNIILTTEGLNDLEIYLTDMNGKTISVQKVTPIKGANFISLNTNLRNGMYLVNVFQNNSHLKHKLLVNN